MLVLAGMYSVPIPRGLSVELSVRYNSHTFRRVVYDDRPATGFDAGYVGTFEDPAINKEYFLVDQPRDRMDFEDITTVQVTVELAGGLCNRSLGLAEVWFTRVPECGTKFKMVKNLTSFSNKLTLPAHRFDYSFGAMKSNLPTFNLAVADYLVRARNDSGEFELTNHTSSSTVTLARFEYHPLPSIAVSLTNTDPFSCTNGQTPSFLKIESLYRSNATFKLTESYPSGLIPAVSACTNIEGTINVTNSLGEEAGDAPLLSVCRDTCPMEVIRDEVIAVTNVPVCVSDTLDNSIVTLACPTGGTIIEVVYASYGAQSTGNCSAGYANSGCKSAQTVSVVAKECIGKVNCTFNVQSATFGTTNCANGSTNYFTSKVTCRVETVAGYANARVVLPLQVGYPNRISPYMKSLVGRMSVRGYIDDVVVVCLATGFFAWPRCIRSDCRLRVC